MFKIGDKVKVVTKYLKNLRPFTRSMIKGDGIVIDNTRYSIRVKFYNGNSFHIYREDLELIKKNLQLEFNFMSAMDSE